MCARRNGCASRRERGAGRACSQPGSGSGSGAGACRGSGARVQDGGRQGGGGAPTGSGADRRMVEISWGARELLSLAAVARAGALPAPLSARYVDSAAAAAAGGRPAGAPVFPWRKPVGAGASRRRAGAPRLGRAPVCSLKTRSVPFGGAAPVWRRTVKSGPARRAHDDTPPANQRAPLAAPSCRPRGAPHWQLAPTPAYWIQPAGAPTTGYPALRGLAQPLVKLARRAQVAKIRAVAHLLARRVRARGPPPPRNAGCVCKRVCRPTRW